MPQTGNNKKIRVLLSVFVIISVLSLFSSCDTKQTEKHIVGIINPNPGAKGITEGFLREMTNKGYVDGENVAYLKSESKRDIDAAIRHMIEEHVDLLLTVTTPATRKARQITEGTGIPVVFVMHDPVSSGMVKSLARPEGNLTGIQLRGSTPKTLEWLLTVNPDAKNIFVPVSFDTGAAQQSLNDLKAAADKLDIRITVSEVDTEEELQKALLSIPEDSDAVFILHSILITSHLEQVVQAATERKLLTVSSGHEHYKKGVVLSYGHRSDRVGEQVSRLADKLLQGVAPRTLPVEKADYFLGINLQTARGIGLKVPEAVLKQADFIVR